MAVMRTITYQHLNYTPNTNCQLSTCLQNYNYCSPKSQFWSAYGWLYLQLTTRKFLKQEFQKGQHACTSTEQMSKLCGTSTYKQVVGYIVQKVYNRPVPTNSTHVLTLMEVLSDSTRCHQCFGTNRTSPATNVT